MRGIPAADHRVADRTRFDIFSHDSHPRRRANSPLSPGGAGSGLRKDNSLLPACRDLEGDGLHEQHSHGDLQSKGLSGGLKQFVVTGRLTQAFEYSISASVIGESSGRRRSRSTHDCFLLWPGGPVVELVAANGRRGRRDKGPMTRSLRQRFIDDEPWSPSASRTHPIESNGASLSARFH